MKLPEFHVTLPKLIGNISVSDLVELQVFGTCN